MVTVSVYVKINLYDISNAGNAIVLKDIPGTVFCILEFLLTVYAGNEEGLGDPGIQMIYYPH